jgi:hypothetical protein
VVNRRQAPERGKCRAQRDAHAAHVALLKDAADDPPDAGFLEHRTARGVGEERVDAEAVPIEWRQIGAVEVLGLGSRLVPNDLAGKDVDVPDAPERAYRIRAVLAKMDRRHDVRPPTGAERQAGVRVLVISKAALEPGPFGRHAGRRPPR